MANPFALAPVVKNEITYLCIRRIIIPEARLFGLWQLR